jgi:cytidine deaminase
VLDRLEGLDRELIEKAQQAVAWAYAPYSLFAVGAAVRTNSGAIYAGANLENASSGLTICAEAAALSAANAAGDLNIAAVAVVGFNFTGSAQASPVVMPCGACRQLIAEVAQLAGADVRVIGCNGDLSRTVVSTIAEMLPNPFGPENLGVSRQWPALREELRSSVGRLIAARNRR